jgi:CRP-like cAMP-binding protein
MPQSARPSVIAVRAAALRTTFADTLDERAAQRMAANLSEWQAQPGEALVSAGHTSRQGFLIVSGAASVYVDGQPVARLGPGSYIWADDDHLTSRPTDVIADIATWVLVLAPKDQQTLRGSVAASSVVRADAT